MRASISLTLCALLVAAAEAGPLSKPHRREAPEDVAGGASGGAFGGIATVVTFVPGDALKGSATGAAPPAVSSFLSGSSILAPPAATANPKATGGSEKLSSKEPAVTSLSSTATATIPLNDKIPTAVTDIPPATGTVSPDAFQINLEAARQFNADFAALTKDTPCVQRQAACIEGKTALCGPSGSYVLTACDAGTSCFALPMNTTEGVQLKCVDKATAEKILGAVPAAPAAPAAPEPAKPTAPEPAKPTASAAPAEGEFTKTATISATSGAVTITLTVRPSQAPPTTNKPAEPTSTSSDVLEVIPVEDSSTTTVTTTIFAPAPNPTGRPRGPGGGGGGGPPGNGNGSANPNESEPPRTRTRTRRPQPEPTSSRDGNGNGGGGGGDAEKPKPTQEPEAGGGAQKGPNEDTRVTFTLIETTTVTQKETVTVTAAGATITARVAIKM